MEALYIWPHQPALSLLALWAISVVILWTAREPMLRLLASLGTNAEKGFSAAAVWCKTAADELRERARATLLAAGEIELQGKLRLPMVPESG